MIDAELAEVVGALPPLDPGDYVATRAAMAAALRAAWPDGAPRDERVAVEDRTIPGPEGAPPVPVRIYRPRGEGAKGAYVYLHGGAFVLGDLDGAHRRALPVAAEAGCVVVSVGYRLAPEHPFPAGLEDCYAATAWTVEHAAELGVDPARVAVGGDSAGGGLAAGVALLARDRGGPALALQLLNYPALDDRLATASMRRFVEAPVWDAPRTAVSWRLYLGEAPGEVSPYAAPARAADLSGLAPAHVVTCEVDPLRDEGIEYARRLLAAGVPVELRNVAGACHSYDGIGVASALGRRGLAEYAEALRRALGLATQPD